MAKQNREEALFTAALAFPVSERERFLHRACADDDAVLERVYALLDARDDAAEFVREADDLSGQAVDPTSRYRILRELGEGGSGLVYLAEQVEPVKRQVALKVLKPGMDSKAVLARFDIERHALALMDHPNIAKVFDAGTTSTGQPYVAMELVRGIKITEYCDLSRLSVPERLNLFLQVCQAVQHAHYQGVIHRDIKPSNVLVTLHDGMPVAKVIDFSIAKAVQGHLTDHTVHTMVGHFIGTPEYVSPEQVTSGLPIDTRSDLYSLGVLLYELLTGHTPFDSKLLQQGQLGDVTSHIREYEAPRPSRRLASLPPNELDEIARQRQTSGSKLIQELRGDLDWIVMRCLEKDRSRRYQTADEIIREIERHLRNEPVSARPPSIGYSLAKFARRNRLLFAAGLTGIAFVVLLFVFAVTTAVQAKRIAAERNRAEHQRQVAQEVSDFMLNVFSAADPYSNHGKELTASELLDRAGQTVRRNLKQHPEVRARLLEAIGRTYRGLDEDQTAIGYLEEAVQLRREMTNPDATATAAVMLDLSRALMRNYRFERAQFVLSEAMHLAEQNGLMNSKLYARLLRARGLLELAADRPSEAQRYLERSLALYHQLVGFYSWPVVELKLDLGNLFIWKDELERAEQAARDAQRVSHRVLDEMHPDRIAADVLLAEVLVLLGNLSEAERIFTDTLSKREQLFGKHSRQVANVLRSLAQMRRLQGRLAQAEQLEGEAVYTIIKVFGDDHSETAYFRTGLAKTLIANGKYDEATVQAGHALSTLQAKLSPDHQLTAAAEHILAEALLRSGRFVKAEQLFRTAIARWKRAAAPEWRVARSASGLGEALYRQGHVQAAEPYLVDSFRTLLRSKYADADAVVTARERLMRFYSEQGRSDQLQRVLSAQQQASASIHKVRTHARADGAVVSGRKTH